MKDDHNLQFDINSTIARFISYQFDDLKSGAKNSASSIGKEITLVLKTKYKNYLTKLAERYGKARSFFIRENPKPLYEYYVPIGLSNNTKTIKNANIEDICKVNNKIIIQGSGGAGKSMLLRHLLLDSINVKFKVPVFIELRDSNPNEFTLIDALLNSVNEHKLDIDKDYLISALKKGHFVILLDGLDEIKNSMRSIVVKEIEHLSSLYDKCPFIVSSRPDDQLAALDTFTTFTTLPLTLKQSILVVSRLPADTQVKKKFIMDLENGLYERHNSFLSNPLLLSIMLLTYGHSADIPHKVTVFYNQAYEALFQRHDAFKGAYKRVRQTDLDIFMFEKILQAFSILTYNDRQLHFSKMQAIDYLKKSFKLSGIEVDSEKYLEDLLQSVCILIQDGLFLTYTHRSFQEYFTSRFIASLNDQQKKIELLEKFGVDIFRDNIHELVYELDTSFFEQKVIIPKLGKLFDEIDYPNCDEKEGYVRYIKKLYLSFNLIPNADNISISIKNTEIFALSRIFESKLREYKKVVSPVYSVRPDLMAVNFLKNNNGIIYTEELKANHEFVDIICFSSKHYSISRLKHLWEGYCFLEEKYKSIDIDLDNLLKGTI